MAKNPFDQVLSALQAGASDINERTGETVAQVADSVSRVLDEAGTEGAKIKRTLVRNWTSLDRRRRGRSFSVALGILAVGAAAVYLLARTATPRG